MYRRVINYCILLLNLSDYNIITRNKILLSLRRCKNTCVLFLLSIEREKNKLTQRIQFC